MLHTLPVGDLFKYKVAYWSISHWNIKSFHGATQITMIKVTSLNADIDPPCLILLQTGHILSAREGLQQSSKV